MSKQLDREKKRAMRAPDPERLNEILRANEIFKRLKHEGRKPPKSWVELLSNKFGTLCPKATWTDIPLYGCQFFSAVLYLRRINHD
jgi:hypothetical protein